MDDSVVEHDDTAPMAVGGGVTSTDVGSGHMSEPDTEPEEMAVDGCLPEDYNTSSSVVSACWVDDCIDVDDDEAATNTEPGSMDDTDDSAVIPLFILLPLLRPLLTPFLLLAPHYPFLLGPRQSGWYVQLLPNGRGDGARATGGDGGDGEEGARATGDETKATGGDGSNNHVPRDVAEEWIRRHSQRPHRAGDEAVCRPLASSLPFFCEG